jgi:hypothetical protein
LPLDALVSRVAAYASSYGPRLAGIVAEEHYVQWIETKPGAGGASDLGASRRVIRSDFVLTHPADGEAAVAFRDAFEVDGAPVRDRSDRLVALLSAEAADGWRRAAAIANESARFNIGSRLVTRNVNVPTFVLELLHDRNRGRFRFSAASGTQAARSGEPDLGRAAGVALRAIEYRERDRPTLVRQQGGGDQPLRGTIVVASESGEIWQTHMTWERGPGGFVDVTFGRAAGIDILVPVRMVEAYRGGATTIHGEATYSNFRRFETSVRVVVP